MSSGLWSVASMTEPPATRYRLRPPRKLARIMFALAKYVRAGSESLRSTMSRLNTNLKWLLEESTIIHLLTSPALQSGDILLSIGTAKIHSTSDLVNACFFLTVNQKVPITVFRAGQEVQVDVTPTQGQPGAVSGAAFAPGYLINSDSSLRLRIEN